MKFFLGLVFLLGIVSADVTSDYTYLVFACEWAPAICESHDCDTTGAKEWWNIHGLWPSGGNTFEDCSNNFDMDSISDSTQDQMNTYWSGLYSANEDFWQHEWTTHGSCWKNNDGKIGNEQDFFSEVITLAQQVDMYNALKNAGISPGSKLTGDDLNSALGAAFGVATVECDNAQLNQILICLDLNYNYVDCPNPSNSCTGELYYPK